MHMYICEYIHIYMYIQTIMTKNYCFKNCEESTESTGQLCLSKNKKENFNKWKSKPIRVMRSRWGGE